MTEYNAPKCRFNLAQLELELGDIVYFDSLQAYTLTAFDETQDGKTFLHWKAPCMSCGKLFDTTTARTVIGTGIKRNCDKHKGNRITSPITKPQRVKTGVAIIHATPVMQVITLEDKIARIANMEVEEAQSAAKQLAGDDKELHDRIAQAFNARYKEKISGLNSVIG